MSDKADKLRAKKLAAAKKKLKQYQTKDKHNDIDSSDASECGNGQMHHHIQSKTDEIKFIKDENNKNNECDTVAATELECENEHHKDTNSLSQYFNNDPVSSQDDIFLPSQETKTSEEVLNNSNNHVNNALEILISEKTNLISELTKQKTLSKEKTLESEELMMQLQIASNRNKTLEDEIKEIYSQNAKLKIDFNDINNKYYELNINHEKQNLKYNEIVEHMEELRRELNEERSKNDIIEKELKNKLCELELSQIKISQISDEASVVSDNRVEALTQTKFMYEQQIRDLQAMVQQLTTERDQANQQYQNYVQHLNKEMTNMNEKNSELSAENERLSNRERSLIEHIGNLEKQIQDNLTKQEALKDKINQVNFEAFENEKALLQKEIDSLKIEKSELNNKILAQESELQKITKNLDDKISYILELEQKIENILSEQPNNGKLLAKMESDKVAASRAMLQNEELKRQLEEVEKKLIQVTNDKVELVNLLDSEQYKNRKIRENYEEMDNKLRETNEKLHFKDEEMIRLTHEQNELHKTILQLNQRIDRLTHYEAKEYVRQQAEIKEKLNAKKIKQYDDDDKLHENSQNSDNLKSSECRDETDHEHDHNHHSHDNHNHNNDDNHNHNNDDKSIENDCHNDNHNEKNVKGSQTSNEDILEHNSNLTGLPSHEAMEKLQERFRKIICEVADLTDEKQRLEHLVLQLQSETETIGEYITLYQTQRRLLKQKDIEKSTQLHMLMQERQEMKEKISNLRQLVESLLLEVDNKHALQYLMVSKSPNLKSIEEIIENSKTTTTTAINNGDLNDKLIDTSLPPSTPPPQSSSSPPEPPSFHEINKIIIPQRNTISLQKNPILTKIHNIITEIKEKEETFEANLKFVPSVDHCACCSGKFETI